MTVIYSEPGLEITCVATREPRISILRLDVSAAPDDFEEAMRAIRSFFDAFKGRLVTHALISSMETASTSQVLSVLRYVMDLQTVMDEKLKGTIVQMGRKGRRVGEMSLAIVNRLYTPSARAARRVFEMVETDAETDSVMDGILAHEAEKRTRKETTRNAK